MSPVCAGGAPAVDTEAGLPLDEEAEPDPEEEEDEDEEKEEEEEEGEEEELVPVALAEALADALADALANALAGEVLLVTASDPVMMPSLMARDFSAVQMER